MSRYTRLRDAAAADRYAPPDELHYALAQNAPAIERLWKAADADLRTWRTKGEPTSDELESAVEALRPLFDGCECDGEECE